MKLRESSTYESAITPVTISALRPWEVAWNRIPVATVMWAKARKANIWRRRLVYLRIFAKDKERRLAKYRRDRRAAFMNPAWRGQLWVVRRYGAIL